VNQALLENRLATTDVSGVYSFQELPAGRYTLTAQKGSYVSLQYGQQRPFEQGRPIDLLDGQTIERVDFSLPPGSVIAGRVLDEFGEPIADAQVSALRYQFIPGGGGRRLAPAGRIGTTNDIGEFRVFGLPPGDYFLSATLRNFMGGDTDRAGYAPTYYPGTADPAGAQRIAVGLGQRLTDLTLPLIPILTARVTGTAVDSQGQPMQGMVMAFQRSGLFGMPIGGGPARIRPDGSFIVTGLAPGEYTLQVQRQFGTFDSSNPEFASLDVTVSGSDISGLRLAAVRSSNATGRVLFSDPAAAQSIRPSALRIQTMPTVIGGMALGPIAAPSAVSEDWTFQTKLRPGTNPVTVTGLPPGWALKAVRQRGTDVTDSGIEVRPDEDVDDIEVELTNRVTDVSGVVTSGRGDAVKDYSVVLFARDPARWAPPSRHVRVSRPDQEGRFKIGGLPPGEYLAVAVDYVEPGEANDPEFLDRVQRRATGFSLGEGESKGLDLKLQTGP